MLRIMMLVSLLALSGCGEETKIGSLFGDKPVWIHHFPKDIKSFYFKLDKDDPRYALGCDLIAPHGWGEVIGGGIREESYETLRAAIARIAEDAGIAVVMDRCIMVDHRALKEALP